MNKLTEQLKEWEGNFGKEYTDRNTVTLEGLDELYTKNFGVTRSALNKEFLDELDRSIRILEVGANTGNQLIALQEMGFTQIYGVEPQAYAVNIAQKRTKGINIVEGTMFDIPFKDGFFDLVFTSGVLIHIHPDDIKRAITELHRCSKKYLWGFEYYADKYTTVNYRGNEDLLWKTDFANLYTDTFSDLKLIKEKKVPYVDSDNVDSMYLLEKNG